MQAFSRIDIWLSVLPEVRRTKFQMTNDITHAVMATPKAQPMESVVYRLLALMSMPRNPPMITARQVSLRHAVALIHVLEPVLVLLLGRPAGHVNGGCGG